MSLQKTLEALSTDFVRQVIAALRQASLEEIAQATGRVRIAAPAKGRSAGAAPKAKSGRLPRRSLADIDQAMNDIVELLRAHPEGLRAEEIRKSLSLDPRELPRPIQEGLDQKRISKKGEKRATTYFASGAAKKKG